MTTKKTSEEAKELIKILGKNQAKELLENMNDEKLFERIGGFLDNYWENVHSALDELEKEAKIIHILICESRRFSDIENLLKAIDIARNEIDWIRGPFMANIEEIEEAYGITII